MTTNRPALWTVLILSVLANTIAGSLGFVIAGSIFGLIAIGSGAALITDHYRRRREAAQPVK
jgi:hypothetical protein